jgi:hypothetical protein
VVNEYSGTAIAAEPGGGLPENGGGSPMQGPAPAGGGGISADTKEEEKPADDTAAEEKPAENLSDEEWLEKLDEWKNQDPKEILEAKYEDLEAKKTTPWNEDDIAGFVPETGRSDPLTPVLSAIPDELKLKRGEDTDPNEFLTYQYEQIANNAIALVGDSIECYSVLVIGLQKIVTIGAPGQRPFPASEGDGFNFDVFLDVPVSMGIQVAAISEDEVTLVLSASPYFSNVNVSRSYVYIPR